MTDGRPAKFCTDCGNPRGDEPECSSCGSGNVTVTVEPAIARAQAGPVGTVIEGASADGDGRRVEFNTPQGGRSVSEVDGSGKLEAAVDGPINIGRPNEPRVLKTLLAKLREGGVTAEPAPAEDDRGEDASLVIDGRTIAVQMVTAPSDPRFWARQRREGAAVEGTRGEAAALLQEAIAKKSMIPSDQRASTMLVLDASAVGAVIERGVLQELHDAASELLEDLQFYAVWVVGPTVGGTVQVWPRADGD